MKKVVIGDCELYLGDCMDILPNLPLTVSLSALKKTKLILRLHKIELLQSNICLTCTVGVRLSSCYTSFDYLAILL